MKILFEIIGAIALFGAGYGFRGLVRRALLKLHGDVEALKADLVGKFINVQSRLALALSRNETELRNEVGTIINDIQAAVSRHLPGK